MSTKIIWRTDKCYYPHQDILLDEHKDPDGEITRINAEGFYSEVLAYSINENDGCKSDARPGRPPGNRLTLRSGRPWFRERKKAGLDLSLRWRFSYTFAAHDITPARVI